LTSDVIKGLNDLNALNYSPALTIEPISQAQGKLEI